MRPPQDCSVIHLQEKRQLLQPSEYREGIAALGDLVKQMREAVLAEAIGAQEEESEPVNPPDDEDDGE